jgi:hypothetical protein
MNSIAGQAKTLVRDGIDQALTRLGLGQSGGRIATDARTYWTDRRGEAWGPNSHWRGELGENKWLAVGAEHWALPNSQGKVEEVIAFLVRPEGGG